MNVVTENNGIASNHSLIIKDLSIQQCDQSKFCLIYLFFHSFDLYSSLNITTDEFNYSLIIIS
jgi:hypothetical protein